MTRSISASCQGLKHAPEFAARLAAMNIADERGRLRDA